MVASGHQPTRRPDMTLPLEPYTVIDLTRARSGPTCVRQLAEMGANVIKVENKGEDDFARDGFDFQNLHRNKRSITLDLKNPRGVEVLKRQRSGRGQWVHTSLLEAMVRMLDFQASRWTLGKEIPPQAGNDHPTGIPTGVFKTSDGHMNIAASGQVMYRRLCEAIGAPALIDDARLKMAPDRPKNRAAMNAELDRAPMHKPTAHWVD